MKSMLQEGPSVLKAIEKAWENSGKPQEFNIKILEEGEKSFWGTIKKPAVISINYNPKRQPNKPKKTVVLEKKVVKSKKEQFKKESSRKEVFNKKDNNIQPVKKQRFDKESDSEWKKDYIQDVSGWLKDILGRMSISVAFKTKIEQKILKIYLDDQVLSGSEEEKMFFISLSHLLMQALKKKHKRKFKNYYLIIHSRTTEPNGAKK